MSDGKGDDASGRAAGITAHLPSHAPTTPQHRFFLSLLTPVRDEEAYLIEFVNYYLLHGVEHFYLYDNDSKIPVTDVLRDYRDVCSIMRAGGDAVQVRAYAHFCSRYKHESKWVAVFDIDEFVLPHKHESFREFLIDYDHCDGIGINWAMFGDGHHATPPQGGVMENYLYRQAKQHHSIKSVVKSS